MAKSADFRFELSRGGPGVAAGVSPAVEPWRLARRKYHTSKTPVSIAWVVGLMESDWFSADLFI